MRAHWHALHSDLVRITQTLSFQARFEAIRRADKALALHADPAALLDRLHGPGHEPGARNAILRGLVAAAQEVDPEAGTTLLLLALWPGLDAVHRRLSRHFRGRGEELTSDLSARAAIGIRTMDLDAVQWVAATLLRNLERDLRRELGRSWAEARRWADVHHAEEISSRLPSRFGIAEGADAELAEVCLARRLRQEIGGDALLVIAVAVGGERQADAAARLGLSREAGRKRWQRAIRKLRTSLQAAA